MITTVNQYREALRETQQVSLKQFPPFSLPKNSEGKFQVVGAQRALNGIEFSSADFIGEYTALLVHKIL